MKVPPAMPAGRGGEARKPIVLKVNGRDYTLFVEPRRTLLDVLRRDLGLTGTKKGCDEGTCGACTVLADGEAVYACMILAVDAAGRSIETIENLEKDGRLHPVQRAFIEEDALQCGFCTPGQILSLKALLQTNPAPTREDVEEALAGNLCRCGAYPKILKAAFRAASLSGQGAQDGSQEGQARV